LLQPYFALETNESSLDDLRLIFLDPAHP